MTRRLRGPRDERGYAGVVVGLFATLLMLPLCAVAVDLGRMYLEAQRVQNAADAGAMAGVTFLPDDFDKAKAAAIEAAARNGFPNSGDSRVSVTLGSKPTQLRVTVKRTLHNAFASGFGVSKADVARHATADYNGPAPMGSPCNTFANEPMPGRAESAFAGQQWTVSEGGAACSAKPSFWAAIAGPSTPKANGDGVMTRTCASGTSGCSGTTNQEFRADGYYYAVRVAGSAVGTPVTIQLFDPAWVEVGDKCNESPSSVSGFALRDDMNPYTGDGNTRYSRSDSSDFCTGDVLNGGSTPLVTSFGLRAPTDSYNPRVATPMTSCAKQFRGYVKGDVTHRTLRQKANDGTDNPSYSEPLARVFRQWVSLCTFTPDTAGTYYLQVRTNVAFDATHESVPGVSTGSTEVFRSGDDTSVTTNGNNRFAVRAVGGGRTGVTISGLDQMGLYANSPATNAEFNLVRVVPATATKTLIVTFFDVGDADQAGTITVRAPLDSNISGDIPGCTGSGVVNGSLGTSCRLTNVSSGSGWNGKTQTVRVPIPASYTCNSTKAGGCWFRLGMSFPGGVNDTTTWSARVEGDPVRLIE